MARSKEFDKNTALHKAIRLNKDLTAHPPTSLCESWTLVGRVCMTPSVINERCF